MTVAALRPVSWSDLWILLNCTAFVSYILQTQGNSPCCLYGLKMIVRCITMPVYRFNIIWSSATQLVNRDRSDNIRAVPVGLHRAFSYTICLLSSFGHILCVEFVSGDEICHLTVMSPHRFKYHFAPFLPGTILISAVALAPLIARLDSEPMRK